MNKLFTVLQDKTSDAVDKFFSCLNSGIFNILAFLSDIVSAILLLFIFVYILKSMFIVNKDNRSKINDKLITYGIFFSILRILCIIFPIISKEYLEFGGII